MIASGHVAYARYQTIAEHARETYLATHAAIWASIVTAAVRLSLTEHIAYPPDD